MTFAIFLAFAAAAWPLAAAAGPNSDEHPWLKWGPFRPNLYVGIRPSVPETLLTSLMWGDGQSRHHLIRCQFAPAPT